MSWCCCQSLPSLHPLALDTAGSALWWANMIISILRYREGWVYDYGDFITPTITHILLCQKEDYRRKQAWPIQWVQREQLQHDNGSHGDGRPAVQQEEVQHWPLPLLLSEFSPGRNRCLLGSKDT